MSKIRYFIAMDCSGSMGIRKRAKAKENYHIIINLLKNFEQAEPIYSVLFSTSVISKGFYYSNNMESFFESTVTGGTYLSIGLEPIVEEIKKTPEDIMNVVVVYSDGDNWNEDNESFVNKAIEITKTNSLFIFVNVSISTYIPTVIQKLKDAKDSYGNGQIVYLQMRESSMTFTDEVAERLIQIIKGDSTNENI